MKFLALIAGAFLCATSAHAAECAHPFDATIRSFAEACAPVEIIAPAELAKIVDAIEIKMGAEYGNVTRGFFVVAAGQILLGLEVDDCLLPSINLGFAPPPAKLSGKNSQGCVCA